MRLIEQIKRHLNQDIGYNNIFYNNDWTEYDIKEFFHLVGVGWLIQGDPIDIGCNGFVVNLDWDDLPLYTDYDLYECDCCRQITDDKYLCDDCHYCCDPSLPSRCCECN